MERYDGKTLEGLGYVLKGLGILVHRLGEWMIDYVMTKEANGNELDERDFEGDQRTAGDG